MTLVKRAKGTTTYISTNLSLKFQAKTPSGYGETALTRFSHKMGKTMFLQPKKIHKICMTSVKRPKGTTTLSPLTYV